MSALLKSSVGELVVERPARSAVFERHGIDYCCGGTRTLVEVCREKGLDADDILREIQESDNRIQSQAMAWDTLTQLCDHIEATHHVYLRDELPRLTHLIEKVVGAHAERNPKLYDVQQVFAELRAELEPHMMKEEQVLFPAIRQLECATQALQFPFGSVANPIHCMEREHDAAGAALSKLRSLTAGYQPPGDACPTYHAMLDGLRRLEADLHQHIHKENNILFPRATQLED